MSETGASAIRFHYLVPRFPFTDRTRLKKFLASQLKKAVRRVGAINCIFCSDDYLLELNQTHLNHDTLTDIITFELSGENEPLIADIYISVSRVRENAVDRSVPFRAELHRVIFHGFLHLIGYKDKKASEATAMRAAEDAWLTQYSVSRDTVSN